MDVCITKPKHMTSYSRTGYRLTLKLDAVLLTGERAERTTAGGRAGRENHGWRAGGRRGGEGGRIASAAAERTLELST